MDTQKDIRDKKDSSLDRHSSLTSNVFISDTALEFIFKKTEKIVTAMYMVTKFFPVEESLKIDIRQISSKLLHHVTSVGLLSIREKNERMRMISGNLLELGALFDISYRTGLVSSMNHDILGTEINKLSENISVYNLNQSGTESLVFDEKMFEVNQTVDTTKFKKTNAVAGLEKDDVLYKGHAKSKSVFYGTVKDFKDRLNLPGVTKTSNKVTSNKERRDQIVKEVSKKGEVSVKDISLVITDCSEKTLQRELLALVAEGVLLKTGERRWSRYSMNS